MLDHIIAVIMRGLLLPWSAGAASSKQPEDCICCRGEGVSQAPTCDGVSPPALPDCFNLYLDGPAHDRDGHYGQCVRAISSTGPYLSSSLHQDKYC